MRFSNGFSVMKDIKTRLRMQKRALSQQISRVSENTFIVGLDLGEAFFHVFEKGTVIPDPTYDHTDMPGSALHSCISFGCGKVMHRIKITQSLLSTYIIVSSDTDDEIIDSILSRAQNWTHNDKPLRTQFWNSIGLSS